MGFYLIVRFVFLSVFVVFLEVIRFKLIVDRFLVNFIRFVLLEMLSKVEIEDNFCYYW